MVPKPRLCTLAKQAIYDEYGFNLHAERGRGHYIGMVDEDSVADYAGLQAGQRLVGVNGHLIYSSTTHKEVLELIKADPLRVELLLASEDIDRWHVENQVPFSYENHIIFRHQPNGSGSHHHDDQTHRTTDGAQKSSAFSQHRSNEAPLNKHHSNHLDGVNAPPLSTTNNNNSISGSGKDDQRMKVLALRINGSNNHRQHPAQPMAVITDYAQIPRPRLCVLAKRNAAEEYGFNLHAERGKGHYIGAVDRDGIADGAGLETGQRIVGVNGQLIYPSTAHKEVVALIKRDPLSTELLVASEEVDRWYAEHRLPYSYETLERAPLRVFPTTVVSNNGSNHLSSSGKPSPDSVGAPAHNSTHTRHLKQSSGGGGHMGNEQSKTRNSHSSYSGSSTSSSSPSSSTHPPSRQASEELPPVRTHDEPPTASRIGNGGSRPPTALPISIEVNRSASNSVRSINGGRGGEEPTNGGGGLAAKELLEQALKEVKPPPSSSLRPGNPAHYRLWELSRAKELDYQKHIVVSTVSPPTPTYEPPLSRSVATRHMTPTVTAERPVVSQFSTPAPTRGVTADIFKMRPRDVQQMLVKRKRDPRLESGMSFEEKHSVIDNL